jgi:hypothetical protein
LPLIAQPSARLEAELTIPPFFIIGIGFGPPVIGAGPIGLVPAIGIGAGLGVIGVAGAPVIVGFMPGLTGAAGIGAGLGVIGVAGAPVIVGFMPGLTGAAGIDVGLAPGANLISFSL